MTEYLGGTASYYVKEGGVPVKASSKITHIKRSGNYVYFCFVSGAIVNVHQCFDLKKGTKFLKQ